MEQWLAGLMISSRILALVSGWQLLAWYVRIGGSRSLLSGVGFLLAAASCGGQPQGNPDGWIAASTYAALGLLVGHLGVEIRVESRIRTAVVAVGFAVLVGLGTGELLETYEVPLIMHLVPALLLTALYPLQRHQTRREGVPLFILALGVLAHLVTLIDGSNGLWVTWSAGLESLFLGAVTWWVMQRPFDLAHEAEGAVVRFSRVDQIIDSDEASIVTVDRDGRIQRVNGAGERFFGVRREEAEGRLFSDVFAHVPPEQWHLIHTLQTGTEYNGPYEGYCAYRRRQAYSRISTRRFYDAQGAVLGAVVRYLDLTHEQEMQQELRRHAQLVSAGRIAARAAHGIRDPVAAVKGLLQMASRKPAGERELYLRLALVEADRLQESVEEFLLLAHPLPFSVEQLDLRPLMDEACFMVRAAAAAEQVALTYKPAEEVRIPGDRVWLRLLFGKLLQYALARTGPRGSITFRGEKVGTAARITCEWTGDQLSAEALSGFFDPPPDPGETGFGLAVCRRIAEDHGGEVTVEMEGSAVRVVVMLPEEPSGYRPG